MYTCAHMCVCACVHARVCVCVCVCVFVHAHIYYGVQEYTYLLEGSGGIPPYRGNLGFKVI